ncbi:secondary thiamine-phosphate synthase enzyme YjbQ [Sulfurirhabdus autotrophica]|uniref:Secondary thiamine-phosphate synthase enzyme n=1 Tax=Sulfurirhabdus autotrophica TaxID=1706046 RepID=A0A4R3YHE8_9PROT|nr:secondary thiamine-phosphate synthase enzyme YjbQ [Sulfurirhabdus autotrophica]TCV90404.1 secondary thiamine-phosphate synthase enzyme [Sulfurirhabdus autotrophica]
MRQTTYQIEMNTQGKGLYSFTDQINHWVKLSGLQMGLLTIFVKHTSASLLIQENYDPDVQTDLERFFSRLVPEGDPIYSHVLEGPDDMPAHVRAALTQTHLSIPVVAGKPALGTWQGVYLYEHRTESQRRHVLLHLIGE